MLNRIIEFNPLTYFRLVLSQTITFWHLAVLDWPWIHVRSLRSECKSPVRASEDNEETGRDGSSEEIVRVTPMRTSPANPPSWSRDWVLVSVRHILIIIPSRPLSGHPPTGLSGLSGVGQDCNNHWWCKLNCSVVNSFTFATGKD